MLLLYSAAIFISAALLFLVQPMAARQVLPLLGGTPAVWTTSMLFFQAALLAGYGYAHGLTKLLPVRAQPVLHLVVIAATVFIALPIGLPNPVPLPPAATGSSAQLELAFYLLKLLTLSVGLPFFVLSTSGPLLTRWFSHTGHRQAADPYFLYAASNAGSFLGLLVYPFAIEPQMDLGNQERFWSWGFMGFGAFVLGCAGILWSRSKAEIQAHIATPAATDTAPAASTPVTAARRAKWVLFAAVPSSLLLGVTQHISTDVAAMPLMWVIPLALYLLTFVLVFARRQLVSARILGYLTAAGAIAVCAVVGFYLREPIIPLVILHVAAFFIATWMCHKRLADDRPSTDRLTEYFLWMSVGGVVGGLFNALISPVIFPEILEYPLAIVVACMLRPRAARRGRSGEAPAVKVGFLRGHGLSLLAIVLVAGLVIAGVIFQRANPAKPGENFTLGDILRVVAPLGIALVFVPRTTAFACALGIVFGAAKLLPDYARERFLFQERSFYGVHRVKEALDGTRRVLMHGTTWHGLQNRDKPGTDTKWELIPSSYFHPGGPLGQMFTALATDSPDRIKRVGILGLGVGSIAAYALPGSKFTFYEIDDVVIRVASDPSLFTYLANAGDRAETRLGDGRLVIAAEPDGEFDLLVLDAFSSDSIPMHLVTKEACQTYVAKLKPKGILAFNVTNKHVDIQPVLARAAQELGLTAIVQHDTSIDATTASQGRLSSSWVLMARTARDLRPMIDDLARWRRLEAKPGDPLWTDGYSSLVQVLKFDKK
ncbi:MAG: fused MFS/spermidine synthase [Phycisphaerales bacterium]|nr:fused MFS/spermidine synthase [Phycisphaerales bacterium]